MLFHILSKLNCCITNCDSDLLSSEENFLAQGDHQNQNWRMQNARQPNHPAIMRSGMRLNENQKAKGNPRGIVTFGAS